MTDSGLTRARGSCLCQDIRWEITGPLSEMSHCHCEMCRKAHGTAFATYATVRSADFRWLSGEAGICHFQSSPGLDRPFCGRCGSCVPGESEAFKGELGVPVGPLEGDFEERPRCHIFVSSAAPWHEVPDDLPRYDAWEPGDESPQATLPARTPGAAGERTGSCLCGGIAYAIEGPILGLVNCHCSRCRRARAAAHGSNGFSKPAHFQWLVGEALLRHYRLPDAEAYGQTFCSTCGSPMPRVDPERDLVGVPAGSLDIDPGVREGVHIFWDSKATWFDVADGLPRFPEAVR